jgi:hypothetical protein
MKNQLILILAGFLFHAYWNGSGLLLQSGSRAYLLFKHPPVETV